MTRIATGYAAQDSEAPLATYTFERRDLRTDDIAIDILYCGVCHSDLHQVRNDWHNAKYPMVPGHEIIGRVASTGSGVSKFAQGDLVAVGCLVDSCRTCSSCENGHEHQCKTGATGTYNSLDRVTGEITQGGYSDHIIVREEFVLRVPDSLDPASAAPLLCAGITTYSPLRRWKVGKGDHVAVVGLGGLGHMGVKLAAALGATVTVITTSASKAAEAIELGAAEVLLATDSEAMAAACGRFNLILDTIPVAHSLAPYFPLLKPQGVLVLVGAIEPLPTMHAGLLLGGNKVLAGSAIGGIPETQELLDFCGERGVLPKTELIAIQDINDAFRRMEEGDVKYRFVIDMATLKGDIAR